MNWEQSNSRSKVAEHTPSGRRPKVYSFFAKFTGECALCPCGIGVGEPIKRWAGNKFVHVRCAPPS